MNIEEIIKSLSYPADDSDGYRSYPRVKYRYWGTKLLKCTWLEEAVQSSGYEWEPKGMAIYIAGAKEGADLQSIQLAERVLPRLDQFLPLLNIKPKGWNIDYLWFSPQDGQDSWNICLGSEYCGWAEFTIKGESDVEVH